MTTTTTTVSYSACGYNSITVGTCNQCGGAVTVPQIYHSVCPPVPTCCVCGARALTAHGPTIPMSPPARPPYWPHNPPSYPRSPSIREGSW